MTRPVVLSLLWSKNNIVALELASRHGCDVAGLLGLFSKGQIEAIEALGASFFELGGELYPKDPAVVAQANERLEAVQQPLVSLVAPEGSPLRLRIADAMLSVMADEILGAMNFVNLFDRLHADRRVSVVLMNEAETVLGKTAAQWGRKHGIPVCVLSHGVSLPNAYTVTREMANVDSLMVFGERGAEPYIDRGFPRDRIFVTGNPAWDVLPSRLAQRDSARRQIFEQCGFAADRPVVTLATTWDANLTALNDSKGYERTLHSFFAACRILEQRGTPVNAVVKDRPMNKEGEKECRRIASEAGMVDYFYVTGDLPTFLMASDVMIGYESSAFVEAMLAGVPAINVWTPLTWIAGPALEREDGLPLLRWDAPDAVADVIAVLLNDPAARNELVARMQSRLPRFHVANDGQSARRCADCVATVMASAARV